MKKLLLIIAALFTIVGCTKTEVVPADAESQEIGLMAINQNSVKAAGPISGTELPTDETMKIWGFYANDGTSYTLDDPYMSGVIYKYQTDAWKGWDGSDHKPYYWPSVGAMKFAAVYPIDYPNSSGAISHAYVDSKTKITLSNVDLSVFANQKDIMYSNNLYSSAVVCPPTTNSVLTFNHLLSQVVVTVKPAVANKITISGVTISDAFVKGDIVINQAASTAEITYSPKMDGGIDVSKANIVYPLSLTTLTDAANFTSVSGKGALVLPSDHTCNLHITYSIDGAAPITKSINIGGTWLAGKKYVYKLTISLNEITFTADVTDWVPEDIPSSI